MISFTAGSKSESGSMPKLNIRRCHMRDTGVIHRAVSTMVLLALSVRGAAVAATTYPDGSIATAPDRCGAGDMCAALAAPDGSRIEVYNEGAARCQAYGLRVVKMKGDVKLFDYERKTDGEGADSNGSCANVFTNTTLTFGANGEARVLFYLNADGTLSARWLDALGDSTATPDPRRRSVSATVRYDTTDHRDGGHPAGCEVSKGPLVGWVWRTWADSACAPARDDWAASHP